MINDADQTSDTSPLPEKEKATEFVDTAKAAKLSGAFHQATGFVKRKFGELTNDEALKVSGRNQEMMGQLHELVGAVREMREAGKKKLLAKREEGIQLASKHAKNLLHGAIELVHDVKKFLK